MARAAGELAERGGDGRLRVRAAVAEGEMQLVREELGGAARSFQLALDIAHDLSARRHEGSALVGLGMVALARDELDRAEHALRQAVPRFREVGDVASEVHTRARLGHVATRKGHFEAAHVEVTAALQLIESSRRRPPLDPRVADYEPLVNTYLAHLYVAEGRLDEAEAAYRRALTLHRERKQPLGEANQHSLLAAIALKRGDVDQARRGFHEAIRLADAARDTVRRGVFEAMLNELPSTPDA